jgi:HPt (histidine-containing phosphotransfer) domain-containing protein
MTTKHNFGSGQSSALTSEFARDPDMVELVKLFVDEMPQRVTAIEECWERGAAADLRRLAHQMKGACGGYGFPQVGLAAGTLEKSLASFGDDAGVGDLEGLRGQVDDLIGMCRRITADPDPGN